MRHIPTVCILSLAALAFTAVSALAFGGESVRLVYAERSGEDVTTKEYLVEKTGQGWRIELFNQGVKRTIVSDGELATTVERYQNPATGDELTMRRKGAVLTLTGSLGGERVDKEFDVDDVWYGSVLLLRDFALSNEERCEFYVTKPEEERVVKLVAVREETETVAVNGEACEAVKVKYTVPGFRGMFWKSYYWYRTSDGLLVKTEETRGGPGTPTVYAELKSEEVLPAAPAVALAD